MPATSSSAENCVVFATYLHDLWAYNIILLSFKAILETSVPWGPGFPGLIFLGANRTFVRTMNRVELTVARA